MLKLGLRNAFQTLYYHLFQELLTFAAFDSNPSLRTQQFLQLHEFNEKTETYVMMIYKFILPIASYVSKLFEKSLSAYLKSQVQIFSIVFAMFLIFLLASLVFSLKFVLAYLKKVVFRSRVLIKIIPA